MKILFEEYWNWKTSKIELQAVALMMKNFKVSPQYLTPKKISEIYKIFSKGDSLTFEQFGQLLIKYILKSQKLIEEVN